ncbi:MAG: GntR family transcriptional regulator [Rhodocyclaceae bacterium]|nr:GntR family transcriptional regulator [Rhodocyclaceae bacterium]
MEQRVFATIREAVLDHRLPPGTKLKEVELAALFGTTRAVVRKVLLRLAHLKLAQTPPNRAALVAQPSAQESRDLFAARSAIECAIVDTLATRISDNEISELRSMLQAELDAHARGDGKLCLKLSLEFHRALARCAGNAVLAEFLEQLLARTPLAILAHRHPLAAGACPAGEHAAVLDALAARDAERAVAAMKLHLASLLARLDLGPPRGADDLASLLGMRQLS